MKTGMLQVYKSPKQYIEFDSTFRNRNLWPNPSSFEVPVSQSGRRGKTDPVDPVCESAPKIFWSSHQFNTNLPNGPTVQATVNLATGIGASSDEITFIVTQDAGNILQQSEGYYCGAVCEDTATGIVRRITYYFYLGNGQAQISVSESFPDTLVPGNSLKIIDPSDITNLSNPLFFVPNGSNEINYYNGFYLYNETRNEYRLITNYDYVSHILLVDSPIPPTWTLTDNYCIRKELPSLVFNTDGTSTSINIKILGGPNIDNVFTGNFIRIRGRKYNKPIPVGENAYARIVAYNGATTTATVSPPLAQPLVPFTAFDFEILPFSYDNMNPFNYISSSELSQQMLYYQIELVSLVIPNVNLVNEYGGKILDYPFVYVSIINVGGTGAKSKNNFISNNPYSTSMVFRASIDNHDRNMNLKFIKLTGDKMKQIIQFRPNDTLLFQLKFPTGELLKTQDVEFFSPQSPNERIQISAMFSFRKINSEQEMIQNRQMIPGASALRTI